MQRIALLVPGLCGPDLPGNYPAKRAVVIETLLSRSMVREGPATFETAAGVFFASDEADAKPSPVAPLSWLADTGQAARAYMLRADPVHLRADQARLLLFDSQVLSIQAPEAAGLVDTFNHHYAERGWHLQAPVAQRWYLTLPNKAEIETVPPLELAGQEIEPGLPRGKDAREWHRLLNEIQMLFHDHPVNQAREAHGKPAINSVWVWGGGRLPRQLNSPLGRVFSDHPYVTGLAHLAEVPACSLPPTGEELLSGSGDGHTLAVITSLERAAIYREADRWAEALQELERHWFAPLLEALKQGALAALDLYPVNGRCYTITCRRLRYFWKRSRSLSELCQK
jgi:hypothetical protein